MPQPEERTTEQIKEQIEDMSKKLLEMAENSRTQIRFTKNWKSAAFDEIYVIGDLVTMKEDRACAFVEAGYAERTSPPRLKPLRLNHNGGEIGPDEQAGNCWR